MNIFSMRSSKLHIDGRTDVHTYECLDGHTDILADHNCIVIKTFVFFRNIRLSGRISRILHKSIRPIPTLYLGFGNERGLILSQKYMTYILPTYTKLNRPTHQGSHIKTQMNVVIVVVCIIEYYFRWHIGDTPYVCSWAGCDRRFTR